MMCFNVYIKLFIKQTNDVEENLGSANFDVNGNDATGTVSFSANDALPNQKLYDLREKLSVNMIFN